MAREGFSGKKAPSGVDRAQHVLSAVRKFGQGTPLGYDWHHHQSSLQLVASGVHRGTAHTGGCLVAMKKGLVTELYLGTPNESVHFQPRLERIAAGDLAGWEERRGLELPSDHRRLLLGCNGGVPSAPALFIPARHDVPASTTIVRHFHGIGKQEFTTVDWILELYGERMPAGCVPVAEDHCGNLILLRVSGRTRGEVLFWDHELELDDAGPLFHLADSLSQFMRLLAE